MVLICWGEGTQPANLGLVLNGLVIPPLDSSDRLTPSSYRLMTYRNIRRVKRNGEKSH
ncbi:hypothetical protein SynBIOSE41_02464 [Synechococcus sp. BIOS-E4-1]|nr:hypothetical protein SynBIOSE41_02464 [Synechococcus sp. BIOS-E4-1]